MRAGEGVATRGEARLSVAPADADMSGVAIAARANPPRRHERRGAVEHARALDKARRQRAQQRGRGREASVAEDAEQIGHADHAPSGRVVRLERRVEARLPRERRGSRSEATTSAVAPAGGGGGAPWVAMLIASEAPREHLLVLAHPLAPLVVATPACKRRRARGKARFVLTTPRPRPVDLATPLIESKSTGGPGSGGSLSVAKGSWLVPIADAIETALPVPGVLTCPVA